MSEIHRFELPFSPYGLHLRVGGPGKPASTIWRSRAYSLAAVVLALNVFAFDAFTDYHVAIAVLYVLVVQLVAATGSFHATSFAAGACGLLTLIALLLSHEPNFTGSALARCAVSLFALATATALSIRHICTSDALREYVQLLDLTHDAIVVHDLNGIVRFWNKGAEALYGWNADEAIGKDFHVLTETQFPLSRGSLYTELMRDGRWEGEVGRKHRDGSSLVVETRIGLWKDAKGRPVAVMATNNNVTARRRSESELERNHAYAAEAERLSKTGSVMRYANSRVMHWSQECFRILGVSPGTQPSVDVVLERTHPDDVELVKGLDQAIRDGKPVVDGIYRLVMPNGEIKHVRFVARLNALGATPDLEYVGALMDITAVVTGQEALQKSMTELAHVMRLTTLGGLATTIAHEVTQPLAAIMTCGDTALCWLDRPVPEVGEAKVAIEQILLDAERSAEIVKQIRAMAQKREPQRMPLQVDALINDAVRLVARECRAALVELQVNAPPTDVAVDGDPIQLQQVIVNLLLNAVQAMAEAKSPRRRLEIRAFIQGNAVQIDVSDSGPGFRDGDIDRIFAAFFTTKESGLGMGLSICRSIVEAHGGRIWAERGEPQGAVFHLELRRRKETTL